MLVLLRRLIVGWTLLYAAVALIMGGTPAAVPVFRLLSLFWLAVLAVCRKPLSGRRWALELVLSNLAFTLLLAEFMLRAHAAWTGDLYWVSGTLEAHRLIPGRDYGDGLRGNRLGYPGPDFSKDKCGFRVAALGDSFAVGCGVPFQQNFLTRLGAELGMEVYNFGVSGAGPREYCHILNQDTLAFQPDLVLVNLFVGNDITESLPTRRSMDPRGLAVGELLRRMLRHAREQVRREMAVEAGRATLSSRTYREVEARRLAVCCKQSSSSMERKWARCFDYLERIAESCRSRTIPLAVILIPDEFQVNAEVRRQALLDRALASAAIDLDLPQRRLREFCAAQGIDCLDLLPAFRNKPETYLSHDTHWNAAGHCLAALAIADWLQHRLPASPPRKGQGWLHAEAR